MYHGILVIIIIIIVFSVPFHELTVGHLRLDSSNSAGLKHHHGAVPVDCNLLRWSLPNSSSVAPVGACLRLPIYSRFSLPSLRQAFSPRVRASAIYSSSYCQRCHQGLLISSILHWTSCRLGFYHTSFSAFCCLLFSGDAHVLLSSARSCCHIAYNFARRSQRLYLSSSKRGPWR